MFSYRDPLCQTKLITLDRSHHGMFAKDNRRGDGIMMDGLIRGIKCKVIVSKPAITNNDDRALPKSTSKCPGDACKTHSDCPGLRSLR